MKYSIVRFFVIDTLNGSW